MAPLGTVAVTKPTRLTEAGAVSGSLSLPLPAQHDHSTLSPKLLLELSGGVPPDRLTTLEEVVDPRARRGKRHRVVTVLGIAVCAVLNGARSYRTIAEWTHDLTPYPGKHVRSYADTWESPAGCRAKPRSAACCNGWTRSSSTG